MELFSSHGNLIMHHEAEETVGGACDGVDGGDAAVLLCFLDGGIAGGPGPEPCGGGGVPHQRGDGVAVIAQDGDITHGVLDNAGGAEKQRNQEME